MGADSNDNDQFWVAVAFLGATVAGCLAFFLVYSWLRYKNRTTRTFLRVVAQAGPGESVRSIYKRAMPAKGNRASPKSPDFGKSVINHIGRVAHPTGHFGNLGVPGNGDGMQLDAVPIDALIGADAAMTEANAEIKERRLERMANRALKQRRANAFSLAAE